jgi:hypothetical protein
MKRCRFVAQLTRLVSTESVPRVQLFEIELHARVMFLGSALPGL